MKRIKFVDSDKIFGIPQIIADQPNLISVFDMESNLLNYYPMNPKGISNFEKDCLA